MKENWVKVFSSTDLMQVKIAEDLLKKHQIESHILSKPDSVMPMLGEAELFTPTENADKALKILEEQGIKE
jgi:hypothetical protein